MQKNIVETIVGAIVLLIAGGFLYTAYKGSEMGVNSGSGYTIKAKFANATGISTGSDVRVGGIKVGVVSDMKLDPQTYEAVAYLHISNESQLPADSSASIVGAGLLGEKFVQVVPGGDDVMLKDGGKIDFTQSSISLEEMIGKFVFSGGGVDKGGKPSGEAPAPAAAPAPQIN